MSAIIDLESVEVEGFLSWGAYPTKLPLANLEQCFVAGKVDGPDGRSNGAGKTSLLQSIIWCLSGKTITNPNPGDRVLNWFTTSDAIVKLHFKNGAELRRIRRRSGETELLYSKAGQTIIEGTLSTTSNQQLALNNELQYDHEVFVGSLFFSQYRQPWMVMADATRKQALERIMGVDRLNIYADVAKRKADKTALEQEKLRSKVEGLRSTIETLTIQLTTSKEASKSFESSRAERREAKLTEATNYTLEATIFELIDIPKLTQRWAVVEKIKAKIGEIQTQISGLDAEILAAKTAYSNDLSALRTRVANDKKKASAATEARKRIVRDGLEKARTVKNTAVSGLNSRRTKEQGKVAEHRGTIKSLDSTIKLWENKSGQVCTECEQEIPADHAASKTCEPVKHKAELEQQIQTIEAEIAKIDKQKKQVEADFATKEKDAESDIADLQLELEQSDLHHDNELASSTAELERQRNQTITAAEAKKTKLSELVETVRSKLKDNTPETTVAEAISQNARLNTINEAAANARKEAEKILSEQNTHTAVIESLTREISTKQIAIADAERDLGNYDIIYKHLTYIYKSYSDRRKIKSHLISRHKGVFNARLHHYLDLFDLDIRISLTDTLGIESNLWGYDFQSGGERGRTDLAFMFAVFDLHNGIHGQQCNVLVLDEPEKALDEYGRNVLIGIIKDDLSSRFETVFVISHNSCFYDVFPHQLTIERVDRLSHITDFR